MDPNWFAYVALLSWPVVALYLYSTRRVAQATLWTILGAMLLLPVGMVIKLPVIPALDKYTIANLAAFVGCLVFLGRPLRFWHGFGMPELFLLMLLIGPFITAELNHDPIPLPAGGMLEPLDFYDAGSFVTAGFVYLLPFFLGRQLLRSPADNEEILRALVIAGLLYSLPMLFEVRMSPQLHNWFYGYFARSFLQQMREGGFRPVVFMGHGLWVAFFAMTTAVAAAALWRIQVRVTRFSPAGVTGYLGVLLILCKTLGALIYGIALVPLVRWATPRLQMRVALVLAMFALMYPLLRLADLVPTTSMVEMATTVSGDRAASLKTRFDQERMLLDHASQRLLFGWGRWGRNRVINEEGRDFSITDGRWIITVGTLGLFGFLAEFGLLTLPIFRAVSALRFAESPRDSICLAALTLILAVNVVDLLPNAWLTPWTWLVAGTLLGRAEALQRVRHFRLSYVSNLNAIRAKN